VTDSLISSTILELCTGKIRTAFRQGAPIPIIAVRESDERLDTEAVAAARARAATEVLEALYVHYRKGRMPRQRIEALKVSAGGNAAPHGRRHGRMAGPPPVDSSVYWAAIAAVRDLAVPGNWNMSLGSQYKQFAFPRSAKLSAIEDKLGVTAKLAEYRRALQEKREAGTGKHEAGTSSRDEVASKFLAWIGQGVGPSSLIGALLIAVIPARFASLSSGRLAIIFLAAFAVLAGASALRLHQAPLGWLLPANRWFTWTTFIAVGERDGDFDRWWQRLWPRRSRLVHKAREEFVRWQLKKAMGHDVPPGVATELGITTQQDAFQFYLRLRVLALLDDLRANHRRWAFDLRRRKRTWPPVLFLPEVDASPALLALLQAISDVRSRRSETDPLLILAASERLHESDQRARIPSPALPPGQDEPETKYTAWLTRMRIDQSPSLGSPWPWVMDYPFTPEELVRVSPPRNEPVARRSLWNLWSRWTLAVLVVVVVGLGLYANTKLGEKYCGGGISDLFDSSHDIVSDPGPAGDPAQCVGIEVNDTPAFVPPDGGVSLAGTIPGPGSSDTGAPGPGGQLGKVTLATVEEVIDRQNEKAEQSGVYATLVYAGPLTAPATDEAQALNAVKELAAVAAWQADNNADNKLLIRIDIANGGLDLYDQQRMADKIVTAAERDSSIVGVIGLGRDTSTTPDVVKELTGAGLAVIATTNSDDQLPQNYPDYFGMAATNAEEAFALQPIARRAAKGSAVIFERPLSMNDPYSQQQGAAAAEMLGKAGFALIGGGPQYFSVDDNNGYIQGTELASTVCAPGVKISVVYLAGRSDDLAGLMTFIGDNAPCFARQVTVLSGDDLTKNEYNENSNAYLPAGTTLYYVALTNTAVSGQQSHLKQDLNAAYDVSISPAAGSRNPYTNPVFTDGELALAYDAAQALSQAAQSAYAAAGSPTRSGIDLALRCAVSLSGGATGTIGFTDVHHGVQVMRVTESTGGTPDLQPEPYYNRPTHGACPPPISQPAPPTLGN
jgi:hypothetical protein